MNVKHLATTAALGALVCGGCAKDKKSDDAMTMRTSPAAMASPSTPTTSPSSTSTATATPMQDKDMTHVLTADEPYYTSSPAQGKTPDGMMKAGTKCIVMMPRGSYCQVMTADGKRAYVRTSGLRPVGK